MMNFTATQDALKQFFEQGSGLKFVWDNEPRKLLRKPYGLLKLGQSKSIGRDEWIYRFRDSDAQALIVGERELVVSCQVFSRSQMPGDDARYFANKARLALGNIQLREILTGVGLTFVETHPLVNLPDFTANMRKESRAAFDVVFRYQESEKVPLPEPAFFDQVSVAGEL